VCITFLEIVLSGISYFEDGSLVARPTLADRPQRIVNWPLARAACYIQGFNDALILHSNV